MLVFQTVCNDRNSKKKWQLSLVLALALLTPLLASQPAHATDVLVNLTARGGALTKAGLGSLFGVSSISGGPSDRSLITNSLLFVSASQGRIGENGSNPFSTEAVAPIIRGTGARMICRFNDLLYGFPYNWQNYAEWMRQVDAATRAVSANYKDVTLAIAPFNEPDNKFQGSFMTDPALPAGTYDQKVNWLWTETIRKIRSIDATIPIMGPNWENYRPWERSGADQTRMRAFLVNAINTNTVPDIMGWHSLGASPGDVPAALTNYYRPLETELNLPGRPKRICVEEYGPGTGEFEGVPGTILKHMAEFERYRVDYASMAIFANGGQLGNITRYAYDSNHKPNGGWYLMNWYKSMQGEYVPVSRWDTRYYQSMDGVASWDSGSRTITVLVGGADDLCDVKLQGVSGLGIGSTVRVRLECTVWDKDPNEADTTVERGGDPKDGTYNIYDKTFTLDASGNLSVPIRRMEGYNAYRILVTPSAPAASYANKYEAENGTRNHCSLRTTGALASNSQYIGGIDFADSWVQFNNVNAPARGIYLMTVRYSSSGTGGATHTVTVNGSAQGAVNYTKGTSGWGDVEMRTVTKRVALEAGNNTIRLTRGNSYAEVDYVDVRPDTHRYDAEFATVVNAIKYNYRSEINVPNYVGGIDQATSYVEFAVDAPRAGAFTFAVAYANGTTSNATHTVTVNGSSAGTITYIPTGGWLSAADPRLYRTTANITVSLNPGVNRIRLTRGTGFAELDYATLKYP